MDKRKDKQSAAPKFTNEKDESKWWASAAGRAFLKEHSLARKADQGVGSKLVAKLASATSVQIALRLPAPDLAKAREIAGRKGIGYQTLLKMLVHEGLERVENQR